MRQHRSQATQKLKRNEEPSPPPHIHSLRLDRREKRKKRRVDGEKREGGGRCRNGEKGRRDKRNER